MSIFNESHMHSVPPGSETHFRVVLASPAFEALPRTVDRHRAVNKELKHELSTGVHALSLSLFAPAEWQKLEEEKGGAAALPASPTCRGGFGI
jgi:BolA protein